jgi:hypothetical protein
MRGQKLIVDTMPYGLSVQGAVNATGNTLDASAEREAYIGRVGAPHWKSGSKTITAVDLMFNSKANGTGTTTVRVSLRDVDTSTGSPVRDDGTIDQSGTQDITAVSVTTYTTFTLDTSRTVNIGDELAVVVDFSAFGTAPSVVTRHWGIVGVTYPQISSYIGAPAWANRGGLPNVRLSCNDGTYIYLGAPYAFLQGDYTGGDFNLNTTTGGPGLGSDQRGSLWVPKKSYDITMIQIPVRSTNAGATAELGIYKDNTLLETAHVVLANRLGTLAAISLYEYRLSAPVRVNAGENIRITLRPLEGANSWRVQVVSFASTAERRSFFGYDGVNELLEDDVSYASQTDSGGWESHADRARCLVHMRVFGNEAIEGRGFSNLVTASSRF